MDKNKFQIYLNSADVSNSDKLLLILYFENKEIAVKNIKEIGSQNGLREIKTWNISDILNKSKPKAVNLKNGWFITIKGKAYIQNKYPFEKPKRILDTEESLRELLPKIKDDSSKVFIEEAITCFEHSLYRSAVVLSWVGAISLFQNYIVNKKLVDFNAEANKRDPKWKTAKNSDDLSKMKEHDFLNILESLSIIGKSLKQELQNSCLTLRNSCGHPNTFKINANRVASHLEILIENVYIKFKI